MYLIVSLSLSGWVSLLSIYLLHFKRHPQQKAPQPHHENGISSSPPHCARLPPLLSTIHYIHPVHKWWTNHCHLCTCLHVVVCYESTSNLSDRNKFKSRASSIYKSWRAGESSYHRDCHDLTNEMLQLACIKGP